MKTFGIIERYTCHWFAYMITFILISASGCNWTHEEKINQIEQEASNFSPVGSWTSVDFVKNVKDFEPGNKNWKGELFLKEYQFLEGGSTSIRWTWKEDWITHENESTRAQYVIKDLNGTTYLFLPWLSGDVTERGAKPKYYVLMKGSDNKIAALAKQPKSISTSTQPLQALRPLTSVEKFDDIRRIGNRGGDISSLDLSKRPDILATLTFNKKTIWPRQEKMPSQPSPDKILTDGMNPGLNVRELHRQGITGKGVNVAIIDQPLYQNHPEFDGKIVMYHDVGTGNKNSMHGPAVASLLVGKNCGTAPGAKLYYVAAPSWTGDAAYYAEALDWILKQNANLPENAKIRVVSVSAAPSGPGSPFTKNKDMWDVACARAKADGVLVLDCTQNRGIIGPAYYDASDPENVAKCKPGFPGRVSRMDPSITSRMVFVPSSRRTTAEQYTENDYAYQYCGRGGLSWSIPYAAGVLALGWQLRPDLTAPQIQTLLFASAFTDSEGVRFIDPKQFVHEVKESPVENRS